MKVLASTILLHELITPKKITVLDTIIDKLAIQSDMKLEALCVDQPSFVALYVLLDKGLVVEINDRYDLTSTAKEFIKRAAELQEATRFALRCDRRNIVARHKVVNEGRKAGHTFKDTVVDDEMPAPLRLTT